MKFSDVMTQEAAKKKTENGATAYNTIGGGDLLDLFAQIGSLRERDETEIRLKFARAYREDPLLATRMLFYVGDIREGGLGERRTFRICLRWLAENHPDVVEKNLVLIPFFNRFDSLFELCGTDCEEKMWDFVAEVLVKDVRAMKESKNGEMVPTTLLAKWMPSENATSAKTHQMAYRAMKKLRMKPRQYRRTLSALRKHINIVERKMSEGRWGEIDYSKVPSYAMLRYGSAFARHDYERFNAYLKSVKKGESKINAGTLYPYDLVSKYFLSQSSYLFGSCRTVKPETDEVIEAQWKALPDYITKPINAVVMADVSGSMWCAGGRPMYTSIGLATYFAQRNFGDYHNRYMTFSRAPRFVHLRDDMTLRECVNTIVSTGIGYNTNLERAFDYILKLAITNETSAEEMPKALIVVSDMEIDSYKSSSFDFVKLMKSKYESFGYELPKLIMWNVEARNDTFLSQSPDVIYLSGQSISTFRTLCQNLEGMTAYEMMLNVLNDPAYARVVI